MAEYKRCQPIAVEFKQFSGSFLTMSIYMQQTVYSHCF